MNKQMFFSPEVKVNFRMRDFFLDFMACIVPGLTFLLFITTLIGGLFIIAYKEIPGMAINFFISDKKNILSYFMESFAFNLWFTLIIIFLAYFTGHLLYRQSPKRPDYASFLRIRNKVMPTEDEIWVVEKGKGIRTEDVQFPYSNLKQYLESRGFKYLSKYIRWGSQIPKESAEGQRSKTIINSAKMRIAFFFPEHTNNLLRNEAHIRLASSMWYASKYTIKSAYICIFLTIIIIFNNNTQYNAEINLLYLGLYILSILILAIITIIYRHNNKKRINSLLWEKIDIQSSYFTAIYIFAIGLGLSIIIAISFLIFVNTKLIAIAGLIFLLVLMLGLLIGKITKFYAASVMHRFPINDDGETSPQEEKLVQRLAKRLDMLWKIYDRIPAFVLFIFLFSFQFNLFSIKIEKLYLWYLGIILFVLLGALFAKHYIEESIHYQRVRELVYVLETAYIAKVLRNKNLPDLLKIEKFSYDVSLNFDKRFKILEESKL